MNRFDNTIAGNRKAAGTFLTVILAMIWAVSCATPVQIIREQSAKEKPAWVDKPPDQSGQLYFVGVSSGDSLDKCRNDAMKDAVSKIGNYLGTSVASQIESISTESDHRLSVRMSASSSAVVYGAALVDTYYEKTIRNDPRLRIEKFDVYVLLSFSKEKADAEMKRRKAEKETAIQSANGLYRNGLKSEDRGDYLAALRFYSDASVLLEKVRGMVTVTVADDAGNDELASVLKLKTASALAALMTAEFSLNGQTTKEGQDAFISHFMAAFSSKGFTLTQKQPQFAIRADVSVRRGDIVMNNQATHASGSVRVIRKSDGNIISEFPFHAKGFHKDSSQSTVNAMMEAGTEAGNITADNILKKLDLH